MILFEDCIGTYEFEEMSRRNWRAWASFQYSVALPHVCSNRRAPSAIITSSASAVRRGPMMSPEYIGSMHFSSSSRGVVTRRASASEEAVRHSGV